MGIGITRRSTLLIAIAAVLAGLAGTLAPTGHEDATRRAEADECPYVQTGNALLDVGFKQEGTTYWELGRVNSFRLEGTYTGKVGFKAGAGVGASASPDFGCDETGQDLELDKSDDPLAMHLQRCNPDQSAILLTVTLLKTAIQARPSRT